MKPYSESCDQNKRPILEVLRKEFAQAKHVLEIGSGTGQHAVFFAEQLPHLTWQTSDRLEYHAGIQLWLNDCHLSNVIAPIELDVALDHWPKQTYDAVFSANSAHIMSAPEVEHMFNGVGKLLRPHGRFCLYGPFNYHGQYTSESNARFDQWLKHRDPNSGIKDLGDLTLWAEQSGLSLTEDYEMPVNNRILVWVKQ
ncbi:MAG: methylase [Gammaproteobacteria bacterium SG8_11]|nr:MAG: methylase [Gammaproteobacteria bacterium SG8_11]